MRGSVALMESWLASFQGQLADQEREVDPKIAKHFSLGNLALSSWLLVANPFWSATLPRHGPSFWCPAR